MKVSLWKALGASACCALALATAAIANAETAQDDVADRTERALLKMSQVDTGTKKVRVVMPASAQEPDELLHDGEAAPVPVAERDRFPAPTASDTNFLGSCSCCECETCCPQCCCLCGPPGNYWVRAEVLGWWTKGQNIPPLVTIGPDNTNPGVLGEPGTEILFGGGDVNNKGRIGGRISAGMWFDPCHEWGIEGDFFALDDSDQNFFASGFDYPFLSRPFTDVTLGLPGTQAVEAVNNDELCGEIIARTKSGFQGAGVSLRRNLWCTTHCPDPGGTNPFDWNDWSSTCCRIDLLAGYRYYRLDDSVYINERLMSIAQQGPVAFGTKFDIFDDFRTRNEFQGGELGFIATAYHGAWFMEGLVNVALGNNHSKVRIDGATTTTVPGQAPNTLPGGLLALPSNIGTYERNDFAAIPHLALKLGYQWNCHLRTFVGYDIIYWNTVARAGEQIDLRIDTNQLPPGSPGQFPEFSYNTTTFWAQGISGGVEVRW